MFPNPIFDIMLIIVSNIFECKTQATTIRITAPAATFARA
jgi:hypothetical protein